MATFFFNRYSNENNLSQWTKHIQNEAYVEDISKSIQDSTNKQIGGFSSIVSQQTKEINDTIQTASREQVDAIRQSTNAICGTLEDGFDLLHYDLQEISYGVSEIRSEINSMSSMLDWKLSLLIEQQKITNLLSGNIAILLRIPDIQKERQYHIEQGLKFLKNAFYDKDFYDDSLNNLLKAEKIEPTDFFALHRIGLIYLYSQKHLDLSKAEDYFKKAAKYAVAETNSGASITTNFLAGDINQKLSEQLPTIDTIKIQAAESYMFTARTCYIEGKLNEAIDYAGKAFSIMPKMVEAGFTQAKVLAANNNDTQAAVVLEKVINIDRFYSLKTIADLDLCPKPAIQSLLTKLQKEATDKATRILNECKQSMISGSKANEYIRKIERLVGKNTYLTSKKALDLLNKSQVWKYAEPLSNPNQASSFKEISEILNSLYSIHYYKSNNNFIPVDNAFIDSFTDKINLAVQWAYPNLFGKFSSNSSWAGSVITKSCNSNVIRFVVAEKTFHENLQRAISDRKQELDTYITDNTQHLAYLETKRIEADNANQIAAVFSGIGTGVMGAFGGLVSGFVVGLVVQVGSCISNGTERGSGKYNGFIFLTCVLGGAILGLYSGYKDKRNE